MSLIKVSEPLLGEEEVEAVSEVLRSGMFVSGNRVREFEDAFAEFVGADHAVAVSSGTSALHLALLGLGLQPGEEVIVPSMTFFATVTAVLHAGGKPVFADVDEHYCLDPTSVEQQVTEKTRGLLPVHLFGYSADLDRLGRIAKRNSLFLLEDCAQAIGTKFRDRTVGSLGGAGAFSFFATKNMTTGEGGMITTSDPEIADLARKIRSHGMEGRDDHLLLGYNHRMTEMEAAIGSIQLRKLPEFNRKRRENSFAIYDRIRDLEWLGVEDFEPHVEHSFFWCPILVHEEKLGRSTLEIRRELFELGVGTRHRYLEPLYRQPMLREKSPYPRSYDVQCPFEGGSVRYEDLCFPRAEKFSGRLLGLPNHPGLTKEQLDRVVDALHAIRI